MEKVENTSLPQIEILYNEKEQKGLAEAVGYGIEEEGLPYNISIGDFAPMDAYELSQQAGLGVSVIVEQQKISVFSRQLKEIKPVFEHYTAEKEKAKVIGKNTARIIKNKPFVDVE